MYEYLQETLHYNSIKCFNKKEFIFNKSSTQTLWKHIYIYIYKEIATILSKTALLDYQYTIC